MHAECVHWVPIWNIHLHKLRSHSGNIITIMIMIAIIIDIGIGAQLLLPKQFRVHFREGTGEGGYQNVYIA